MPIKKTYANRIKKGAARGSALGAPGASVGMAGAVIKNALERNKRSSASKLGWHRKKDIGQRKKREEIEAEVRDMIQEMGSGKDIKAGMKKGAKTGARNGAIAGASLGGVAGGLIAGAPGAVLGGLTGAGVGSAAGSAAGSVVGAAKGAFKRRSTEEEIQAELRDIIAEADGVDEGMFDRVKKGAISGARQGAYRGMYASDSATMSFGPTTGALVHGAHVVAGGLTGAARAAFSKDDEDEMDDLDQQDEAKHGAMKGAAIGAALGGAPGSIIGAHIGDYKDKRMHAINKRNGKSAVSMAKNMIAGGLAGAPGAIAGFAKSYRDELVKDRKEHPRKKTEAEIAEEIAEIIEGENLQEKGTGTYKTYANRVDQGAKIGSVLGAPGAAAGYAYGVYKNAKDARKRSKAAKSGHQRKTTEAEIAEEIAEIMNEMDWKYAKKGAKYGAAYGAATGGLAGAVVGGPAGALGIGAAGALGGAIQGAAAGTVYGIGKKPKKSTTVKKKTTESEIAEEIEDIMYEGERLKNAKKGAAAGAKLGAGWFGAGHAIHGALSGALSGVTSGDSTGKIIGKSALGALKGAAKGAAGGAAYGAAAGGAFGALSGKKKKKKSESEEGYIERFLAETTGMYAVGTAPIPGFVPGGDKVKIKDMGDGKFSIVVLEDGSEIEVDSGLSGDEAKDLATEYAQMFTSGSYVESSDVETRKENKMISTKKLIEAVARGADPRAAVAQFLRSKLAEDTDVATMLPATDTQAGELPGVDVEDPEDDAVMDAEIGPGSPIVPMADQTPVDAAVPSTELGTKEGEAAVDAAVAAADSAEKDDEFMEGRSPAFKRRVRESLARIVEEEGGGMPPEIQAKLDAKDDDEEGGEEEKGEEGSEEKKEARARRIRARIREARRRRLAKIREEEEEFGDEEGGEEEMEEARSNFRTTQRNESDAIHRGRHRRATTGQRFESVANIFTQTVREQEEGTPEPPGSEMLPDEGDEEVILAPVEGRRRRSGLRARLEARRRARRRAMKEEEGSDDDKEAVNFPPSQYRQEEPAEPGDEASDDEGEEYKGEGLISDLTKGDVDDDEDAPIRVPESISRRRAKFLEARRRARRRLKEHINPMLQPGMKVVERSSGKRGRIVDNEVYAKGGHQYMVAFFDESRTRRVRHDDIDKA